MKKENLIKFFIYFFLFSKNHLRYDVEYDENRLEIARDIAKRFLGIGCEDTGGGDDVGGGNGCDTKENITKDNLINSSSGRRDELVLDVLNDDLLEQVERKITSKYFFFLNFLF